MRYLKDDVPAKTTILVDVTAVEFPGSRAPLEVVYFCASLTRKATSGAHQRRAAGNPTSLAVRLVYALWHGAIGLEREVFDMFGICPRSSRSAAHPDVGDVAEGYPRAKTSRWRGASPAPDTGTARR